MKHETELAYTLSDEILVEKILEGETHLYEKIIRKFNQKLYRISKSIVEDDQEVEDVMQISYLNAYPLELSKMKRVTNQIGGVMDAGR
jgi:hypothetical protein